MIRDVSGEKTCTEGSAVWDAENDKMDILMLILGALGGAYGLWFVMTALLGSLRKYKAPARAMPLTRFAVIVPARNEENVVGHLVKSLMAQDYPGEKFDVIVIPNNCADATAEAALDAGAQVLECDVPVKSKGDVLRFALERLEGRGYDAYCILDADNLAAPGFLQAANDAIQAGWEVAQGHRDSKNPSDSWVAGDTSIFFWIMNRFYYRARSALGMSAALNGTGIVLSSALVKRLGWNMVTLTEDLEFTGLCAAEGVKIGFMDGAVVYDEQPVGIVDSIVQRRRWFKGGMQCFGIYAGKLIGRHSLHAVDMLCVFGGWIMQIVCMIPGVATASGLIMDVLSGRMALTELIALGAGLLAAAYIACALAALMVCVLEKKLCARRASAILMFPVFMATWFIANLWAMITRAPVWKQIAHVRGTDVPE